MKVNEDIIDDLKSRLARSKAVLFNSIEIDIILEGIDKIRTYKLKPNHGPIISEQFICPYCGYEEDDTSEIEDGDDSYVCSNCENEFNFERSVTTLYTTQQITPF